MMWNQTDYAAVHRRAEARRARWDEDNAERVRAHFAREPRREDGTPCADTCDPVRRARPDWWQDVPQWASSPLGRRLRRYHPPSGAVPRPTEVQALIAIQGAARTRHLTAKQREAIRAERAAIRLGASNVQETAARLCGISQPSLARRLMGAQRTLEAMYDTWAEEELP